MIQIFIFTKQVKKLTLLQFTHPARLLTPNRGLFHHPSDPQRPSFSRHVTADNSRRQRVSHCAHRGTSYAHKSVDVRLEEAGMDKGTRASEAYGQKGRVCQVFPFLSMKTRTSQTKSIPRIFFFLGIRHDIDYLNTGKFSNLFSSAQMLIRRNKPQGPFVLWSWPQNY